MYKNKTLYICVFCLFMLCILCICSISIVSWLKIDVDFVVLKQVWKYEFGERVDFAFLILCEMLDFTGVLSDW